MQDWTSSEWLVSCGCIVTVLVCHDLLCSTVCCNMRHKRPMGGWYKHIPLYVFMSLVVWDFFIQNQSSEGQPIVNRNGFVLFIWITFVDERKMKFTWLIHLRCQFRSNTVRLEFKLITCLLIVESVLCCILSTCTLYLCIIMLSNWMLDSCGRLSQNVSGSIYYTEVIFSCKIYFFTHGKSWSCLTFHAPAWNCFILLYIVTLTSGISAKHSHFIFRSRS